MFKVLLVDDDVHTLDALSVSLSLQWEGITILTAQDGRMAARIFFDEDPDLVILAIALPDESGFDVLRQIRQISDAPVVVLSNVDDDTEHVRALELGADDYVVKPFNQLLLLARIRAILRRAELPAPASALPDFEAGELAICFENRRVTVDGRPVRLTPVEFRLLYHLVRNAGRLLPHEALLDRLWNGAAEHTTDHLKVYVSRLRSKIEHPGGPRYIENERGLGYRFVRPPLAGHGPNGGATTACTLPLRGTRAPAATPPTASIAPRAAAGALAMPLAPGVQAATDQEGAREDAAEPRPVLA